MTTEQEEQQWVSIAGTPEEWLALGELQLWSTSFWVRGLPAPPPPVTINAPAATACSRGRRC